MRHWTLMGWLSSKFYSSRLGLVDLVVDFFAQALFGYLRIALQAYLEKTLYVTEHGPPGALDFLEWREVDFHFVFVLSWSPRGGIAAGRIEFFKLEILDETNEGKYPDRSCALGKKKKLSAPCQDFILACTKRAPQDTFRDASQM